MHNRDEHKLPSPAASIDQPTKSVSMPLHQKHKAYRLTVRLLVSGAGTWTAKLLWLAPSVVGNEEGSIVLNKRLLELVLGVLINELLVVGDLYRMC